MASEAESFMTQITEEANDKADCPEAGQADQAEVIITQIVNQQQDSKAETAQEATEKTSRKPSVDADGNETEKGEVFINEEVESGLHVGEMVSEHMQEKKEYSETHVAISDHKSLPGDQARDGPESVLNQILERSNTDYQSEINTGDQERCIERTLPKAMLALQENFEATVCKGHKPQSIAAVEGSEEKVQNENKKILKNSNEETLFNGLADTVGAQTATSFVDEEEALISPESSRLDGKKRCSQGGIDITLGGASNYAFEECCQDTSKSSEKGKDEITVENKEVESYIVHQEAVASEKVENNSAQTLICRTDSEVTIKDVLHKDNQQNDSPKRVAENPIEENSCTLVSEDELYCHQKGQGLARVQASKEKEMDNRERNTNSSELMRAEECIEKTVTKQDETERDILEENMEMVSEETEVVEATEDAAFPQHGEEKLDVVSGNQGQGNDTLETDNFGTTGILQDKTSGAVKERTGLEDSDISQNDNDSSFEYEEVDFSLGKKDENQEGSSKFEPTQQEEQDNEASPEQKIHNQQVSEVNKSTESIVLGNSDEEEIAKNLNSTTSGREEGKFAELLQLEPERGQETNDAEGSTESDIQRNEIQRDQHEYTTIRVKPAHGLNVCDETGNEAVSPETLNNSPEIKQNMTANMVEEAVDLTCQQDKGEEHHLNKALLNLSQNICEEGDIIHRSSKEGTMIEETTEKLTHSDPIIEQIKEEDPEDKACGDRPSTPTEEETTRKSCGVDMAVAEVKRGTPRAKKIIAETESIPCVHTTCTTQASETSLESSISVEMKHKCSFDLPQGYSTKECDRSRTDEPDIVKDDGIINKELSENSEHRDQDQENSIDFEDTGPDFNPKGTIPKMDVVANFSNGRLQIDETKKETALAGEIFSQDDEGLNNRSDIVSAGKNLGPVDAVEMIECCLESAAACGNSTSSAEANKPGTEESRDVNLLLEEHQGLRVTEVKVEEEDEDSVNKVQGDMETKKIELNEESSGIEEEDIEEDAHDVMVEKAGDAISIDEEVHHVTGDKVDDEDKFEKANADPPQQHSDEDNMTKSDNIEYEEEREQNGSNEMYGTNTVEEQEIVNRICEESCGNGKRNQEIINEAPPSHNENTNICMDSTIQVNEAQEESAHDKQLKNIEDVGPDNINDGFSAIKSAKELQVIEEFQGNERTSNDKDFQQDITSEGIKNEVKYMDATSDPSQLESKRTSMSDCMEVQENGNTYELEKSSEMDGLDMAKEKELLIQGPEADKASIEIPNHQISASVEPPLKSIGWEDQSHEESKDEEKGIKVNTEAGLMCHTCEHERLENLSNISAEENPNRVDSVENPECSSKSIAASQGSISAEETDSQVIYVDTLTSASKGESMIADVNEIVAKEPDASQVAMTSEQCASLGSQSCEDVLAPKFDIKEEANVKEEKQGVDCYQTESTTESTNAEITNDLFGESGAPVAAKTLEEYDPLEKIQSSEDSLGPESEIPKEGINEEENYGETENITDISFPMVEHDLSEEPYAFIAASTSEKNPEFDIPKEDNEEEKQQIDSDETAKKTKTATAEAGDGVSEKPDASIPTKKIEDSAPLEQNQSSEDVLVPELDIPEEDTKEKEQEVDRNQTENMIDTVIGEVKDHLSEKTKEQSEECKPSKDSHPSEYILGQESDMSKEGVKEEAEVFETENKTGTVNIGDENDLLEKQGALSAATSDESNSSKESRLSENILAPELDIPKDENKQTKQDAMTGEIANETEAVIAELEDDVPEKPAAPITAKTFEECEPLEQNQSSGDVITTEHAELEDDVAEESVAPITAQILEECEPLEQNQSPVDVIATEHAEGEDDVPKEPSAPITAKTVEECEPLEQYQSFGDVIAIEHEIATEGNYEKEKQGVDCSRTENMTGTVNSEVEDQYSEVPGTSIAGKASEEYKQLLDCPSSEDVLDHKFDTPKEGIKEEETGECETENKTELLNPEVEEILSEEPGYLIEEKTPEESEPMEESQSFEDVQGHKWNIPAEAIKDGFLKEPSSFITEETSAACESSEDIQSPKCVKTPEFDIAKGGIKENLEVDFGETEKKIQVATREVEDDVSQESDALVADSKECTTLEPSQSSANVLVPELDLPKEGDKEEVKQGANSNLTEDTKENVTAEVKDDLSENADKTSEEDTRENVAAEVKNDLSENAEKTSEERKQLKENLSSEAFLGQEQNISKEGLKKEEKEGEVFETENKTASEGIQSSKCVLVPEFDIRKEGFGEKLEVDFGETAKETEAVTTEVEDNVSQESDASIAATTSEECATLEPSQSSADVMVAELDIPKEGIKKEEKQGVNCDETANKAEAETQHDSDEPGVPIAAETLAALVTSEETQSSKDVQASKFYIPEEHNKEANQNENSNETAIETETVTREVKDDLSEGPKTAEENAPLEKSQSDLAPGLDNPKEGIQEEEKQGAKKKKTQDLEAKDDLSRDLDASIASMNLVVSTKDNELADVGKEFPPEVEKLENLAADVVEKISFPDIEHQSGNVAPTVLNANQSVKQMLLDNCQEVNVIAADALVGIQILQANERQEQIWQPSPDELECKHTPASTNEETGENTRTIHALKQDKPDDYHPENTRHEIHLAEEKQREIDESSSDFEPSMHLQSEQEVMENALTTDESLMSEPGDASGQGASASSGTKRKSQSYSDNDYQRLEGADAIDSEVAEEVKHHNVVTNQLVVYENQSENFGEHETTVCDTITEETLVPADPLEKLEGSSELLKSSEEGTKLDETDRAENTEASAESHVTRSAETLIGDDYKDKKGRNIEGNEIKRDECSLLIAEDPDQASKGLEISDDSNSIDEEPTMEESQQARTRERTDSNSVEVNSKDAKGYAPEPPSQSNASELDNLELQKDEFAHEVTGSSDTAGSDSEKGELVNQGSDEGITSSIAKSIPQTYRGVEASGMPRDAERNIQNQDESTEIHGNSIEGVKLDEMETKEIEHHLIYTEEVKCIEKPDSENKMDKTKEEMKDYLQEELIGSNATNSEDRAAIKESDEPEEAAQEFDVAIENTIKEDQQVVACHDNMLIVKDMTLLASIKEPHPQRNIEKAFNMSAFEEDTQANGARLLSESVEKLEDLAAKQAKEITLSPQLEHEHDNVASKEIDANKPTKTLVDGTDEGVQVSNVKSPMTSHSIEELTAADIIATQISLAIEREEQLQQLCSQKLEDIQEAKVTTDNNTLNQVLEDADDRKTLSEARKRELEVSDSKYETTDDCQANQELGQKVSTTDASSITEPEDLPSQFQGVNPPSESETNRKPETCTSDLPQEILNAKGSNNSGVTSNVPPHIDTKSHTIPQENLGASCKLSKKCKTEGHEQILELHVEGHAESEKIDVEHLKTTSSGLMAVQKGARQFEAHEATIGNVAKEEVEVTKDAQGISRGSVGEETKAQASEKSTGDDEKQAKIATEKESTDEKVQRHDPEVLQERLQATESPNKTEKAVTINEREINAKCIVATAAGQADEQAASKGSFIVAEIPQIDASNSVLKTPETSEQRKDSVTDVSDSPTKPKKPEQASNAMDGFPFLKYPKDTDGKQFKLHMENQQESEQGLSEENRVRPKDDQDKDSLKTQQLKDVRKLGNTNVQSTLIEKEDGEEILPTEKTADTEDIAVGSLKTDEEKDWEGNDEHQADSDLKPPFLAEASRDMDLKANYKKPHNILSGVGSKVKHSISKVKKAITCSSSQFSEEDVIKLNKNKKI